MRCSWFEARFDRYIESTLAPREMRRVREHFEGCPSCAALLAELRVADALLATSPPAEIAPNFTHALMAGVRSMPAPKSQRQAVWPVLAFYLVATWVCICGAAAMFGGRIPGAEKTAAALTSSLAQPLDAVGGAARAFSPAMPA
ncbi:MAG: zf-HC2 domain-containing protein, partial [Candidatus Eremiobacteraeota bacterium]|nr:zf-HC2 domain-containing protein [Candidatus Eremiobacteraeota bacterium]